MIPVPFRSLWTLLNSSPRLIFSHLHLCRPLQRCSKSLKGHQPITTHNSSPLRNVISLRDKQHIITSPLFFQIPNFFSASFDVGVTGRTSHLAFYLTSKEENFSSSNSPPPTPPHTPISCSGHLRPAINQAISAKCLKSLLKLNATHPSHY